MNDLVQLQKKQNQILILICINFVLFMVLFLGLGYVTWQSAVLVNRLKSGLDRAEHTVASLQERFVNMEMDAVVDNLATASAKKFDETIRKIVQDSELSAPLARLSEGMAASQEIIEQTGEAIEAIHETVKELDNEKIAQMVSYHILRSLSEGFHNAAETSKPVRIGEPIADPPKNK